MVPHLPGWVSTLLGPFFDPGSRTFWGGLLASALVAGLFAAWPHRRQPATAIQRGWRAIVPTRLLTHRSTTLDVQLLLARQLLSVLGLFPAVAGSYWLASHTVRALDGQLGAPQLAAPLWLVAAVFSLTLFIAWDASRYLLHRLMHEVPALWAFHQVHHSAEVLTPLTFHRIHPVESILYQLRGALVTGLVTGAFFWAFRGAASDVTLLGVNALGLVFNVTTGNLRHSHVWLRFGPRVERWLMSPAQHQLHHADDPAFYNCNYGTWIALWDRLAGTLVTAPASRPAAFGIPAATRNHGDDLLSAWFGPIRATLPRRRVAMTAALLLAAALLIAATTARAESPDASLEIIVVADQGVPRVVGSAHVISEEELERFERSDIQEILAAVPGVYVRTEDGFGLRPNIGLRGANSDRSAKITLLEDGVLLAPAPYAAPAAYYFPMAVRLAGIEVFKGPAATQHGPHTVGGAINVLTRSTPADGVHGTVDIGYGSRETTRLHAFFGAGDAQRGFLIESSLLDTSGFKVLDTGGPTGFTRGDVMFKGRLGTDPARDNSHTVELKLGYGTENADETYLGLTPDDFAVAPYRRYAASQLDQMRWNRTQAELAWVARRGANFDVRTVAYHHYLTRDWDRLARFAGGPDLHALLNAPASGQSAVYVDILRGVEDAITDDQLLLLAGNDRQFHSGGVQSRARLRSKIGPADSQLEAGVRIHADQVRRYHTETAYRMVDRQLEATDRPVNVATDSDATALALAAHLHETLEIGRFTLVPGVRTETIHTQMQRAGEADAPSALRAIALPGLGAMAQLAPHWNAFVGFHRGFSPVAPGEAAEVRPETSWNTEVGLRAGHAYSPRGELVAFVNDYTNITGQCTFSGGCAGDDVDRQFNGGRAWVYGAEAAFGDQRPLPADLTLRTDLSYTWTESTFRTGFVSGFPQFGAVEAGMSLPYMPRHQGAVALTLEHARFSLASRLVGRGGMLDTAGDFPVDAQRDVPALVTLDLAAHARLNEDARLWANMTNVTNTQRVASWRPYGARPPAPQAVMVGVQVGR